MDGFIYIPLEENTPGHTEEPGLQVETLVPGNFVTYWRNYTGHGAALFALVPGSHLYVPGRDGALFPGDPFVPDGPCALVPGSLLYLIATAHESLSAFCT